MLWTCAIENVNGEKIVGTFYEKILQKTNQTDFRVEKVIEEILQYISSGKDR